MATAYVPSPGPYDKIASRSLGSCTVANAIQLGLAPSPIFSWLGATRHKISRGLATTFAVMLFGVLLLVLFLILILGRLGSFLSQ